MCDADRVPAGRPVDLDPFVGGFGNRVVGTAVIRGRTSTTA
jgi:hypothetical protein